MTAWTQGRQALARTLVVAACLSGTVGAPSADEAPGKLTYDGRTRGPVPIPPGERDLQSVVAQPWFKVSDEGIPLEGPSFDRAGDLLLTDAGTGRVLRLTPDRRLTTVVPANALNLGGLAIHGDGRIFAAGTGGFKRGSIVSVGPDGSDMRTVIPSEAGYVVNDLVFDAEGGFYFTDFRGTSTDPKGGAYYVAPDLRTVTPILPNLAQANGVALSPDGKTLWITEFGRNLLHRVDLADATTPTPLGTTVAYHFTGPAPDSMRADSDGNLYVALYGQGRVLAFNRNGIPIGQVLLPGRDDGHNLRSTSMALRPSTDDLLIVTNDGTGGQGSTIFHARAFAKALPLFSHR
ncbi:SMP-30/gluconolactonase/LRE family protein [Methylobacterium sp. J-078]|uniref:SMP-30/gluconolactonase/LRE family protein n=1 Tax=Methylobacterium sp. J-078 TaxID=2836657 RepID=UPI001FB948D1|nr:SMP-30/gluconolactonase/LRE family protein [Methylobacterium sp. J-078]MCJ2046380.1 SMP-30/gluconolactonase/LRE family protein [Methylobacterium sp. J-078]